MFGATSIQNNPGTAQVGAPLKAQKYPGDVRVSGLYHLLNKDFFENPKTSYSTGTLNLKLYIGRKLCGILGKNR